MPTFAGIIHKCTSTGEVYLLFSEIILLHFKLCLFSSSVLDRLNCLLEPGGYLSIDERGVVDKTVPVIHPHPDFRYPPFVIKFLQY